MRLRRGAGDVDSILIRNKKPALPEWEERAVENSKLLPGSISGCRKRQQSSLCRLRSRRRWFRRRHSRPRLRSRDRCRRRGHRHHRRNRQQRRGNHRRGRLRSSRREKWRRPQGRRPARRRRRAERARASSKEQQTSSWKNSERKPKQWERSGNALSAAVNFSSSRGRPGVDCCRVKTVGSAG